MKHSRRLSLISSISKGRVLSGEHLALRPLPPIVKMKTIAVDNRHKRVLVSLS